MSLSDKTLAQIDARIEEYGNVEAKHEHEPFVRLYRDAVTLRKEVEELRSAAKSA